MKLPINQHITACFSMCEIAEKMNEGDYSAEMLLQHLAVHWNRAEEALNLCQKHLQFLADNVLDDETASHACAVEVCRQARAAIAKAEGRA